MKRPKRAKPMSLEQLEVWFDKAEPEPPCNGVSMLNGFLTGLAVGPVFLLPNDWMFHVIGEQEKRAFIGTRTQAVIDTIVDHYNLVAHQLTTPGGYAPVLMRTDEDDVLAGHWADGFLGAITLNPQEWEPLFAEKQTGEPLMSLLIQCTRPELDEIISIAFPKPTADLHQGCMARDPVCGRADLRSLQADALQSRSPGKRSIGNKKASASQ